MQTANQINFEKLNYFLDYFDKNQKGFNKLLHMVQVDNVVPNVQQLTRSINQTHGELIDYFKSTVNEIKRIRKDTKLENEKVVEKIAQKVGDKITKKVVNRTDKIVRGKVRFYNRKSSIASRHYTITSQRDADNITKDGLYRCFQNIFLKVQGQGRHKSYFVICRFQGILKYISLGAAKKITLEKARTKGVNILREIFADDRFFINHVHYKRQEKEIKQEEVKELKQLESIDISKLVHNYIPLRQKRYKNLKEARQFQMYMLEFLKYVKKTSPKININDIEAEYIANYLKDKFKTTYPLACKILSYLQGFFKHLQSIRVYHHSINPCVRSHILDNILIIEKPKVSHMASLSWRDLPLFINMVKNHQTDNELQKAAKIGVQLLILTGLRFAELFGSETQKENQNGLNWKWINFENKIIKIPKGYMKNPRYGHSIPITPKIKELLLKASEFFPESETVFNFHSRDKAEARTLLNMINKKSPIYAKDEYGDFVKNKDGTNQVITLHGFRTTLSTFIAENFNVSQIELDSFLHHITGTITNTYLSGNFHDVRYQIIESYERFIYLNELPQQRERLKINHE